MRALNRPIHRRDVGSPTACELFGGLSAKLIWCYLPPIGDQLLSAFDLGRKIRERPFLRWNSALDLTHGRRALLRVIKPTEAVEFEATIVGHHVLKADMREPAELQKFARRKINADSSCRRCFSSHSRCMSFDPAGLAHGVTQYPKLSVIGFGLT